MSNIFTYWVMQYHLFWLYWIPIWEPEYKYHLRQYTKACRDLGLSVELP